MFIEGKVYAVRAYVKVGNEYIYDAGYHNVVPFSASRYLPVFGDVWFYSGGYYPDIDKAFIRSLHCKITAPNGYPIKEYGMCYGKTPEPTIETDLVLTGELNKDNYLFFDEINDLEHSVYYHFRFWAINEAGIAYSENFEYYTYNGE